MNTDDGKPPDRMRAVCIAGTHSGYGKTPVSLALMAALAKRGQGFE